MKLGIHAMAWTAHWSDESLPLIDRVAELGLDFIEIPLMDVDDVHPGSVRARLDAAGIDVVTSTVLSERTDITSPDPDVRAAGVAYLRHCVDVTAELGSPQLSGVIYGMHGKRPHHRPHSQDWEWAADCLADIADHAAHCGLAIGLEPVNRYESPLLNTCEQAVELADMVGAPNVRIHLDTYHMNIEEKGFGVGIVAAREHLKYIHLSESDRGTPGLGNVHWDDVFAGLRAIGYDGRLAMESFVAVNEDIIGPTAIWRDIVGDPDTLIRDGLAFLQGKSRDYELLPAAA